VRGPVTLFRNTISTPANTPLSFPTLCLCFRGFTARPCRERASRQLTPSAHALSSLPAGSLPRRRAITGSEPTQSALEMRSKKASRHLPAHRCKGQIVRPSLRESAWQARVFKNLSKWSGLFQSRPCDQLEQGSARQGYCLSKSPLFQEKLENAKAPPLL